MSWFDRRAVLFGVAVGVALGLSGCGFRPLYSRGQAAAALRGRVRVERIDGREGFFFREKLTERLGQSSDPEFRLTVRLNSNQTGLAITQSANVTRYNIDGAAAFTLIRLDGRRAVLNDTVRATAGYSATGSAYATQIAERDARERLAITLADKVASRVLLSAEEIMAG
jgi:LPS-assembly lipoprotein